MVGLHYTDKLYNGIKGHFYSFYVANWSSTDTKTAKYNIVTDMLGSALATARLAYSLSVLWNTTISRPIYNGRQITNIVSWLSSFE